MTEPSQSPSSVCIGISVYKQPINWLRLALDSVLKQTLPLWQLRIQADGAGALNPETLHWLESLAQQEPRISLLLGKERLGCFGSYRELFQHGQEPFIVQLDADDALATTALENAVTALSNHPEAPYLYSHCELINDAGNRIGRDQRALQPWSPQAELVQFIPFHLRVIRREAYQQVNGYDGSFRYTGDYDLSLKLSELGPPLCLQQELYRYRLHRSSASQQQRLATHLEAIRASRAALQRRGLSGQYTLLHCSQHEKVSLRVRSSSPVLVAGMHRSGTSLASRMLEQLGVQLGSELIAADTNNPDGYQEDRDLVAFHTSCFQADLNDPTSGWPDWGWDPQHSVSALGRHQWRATAHALMQHRRPAQAERCWGWKDPRSTMVLPFWREINQSLQVLGIYRAPWDLSDALQRISHPEFRRHPEKILPLWATYNRRLLEYRAAYPEETVLIHAQRLCSDANALGELLENRWDFRPRHPGARQDLQALVRSNRLPSTPLNDPIERLYRMAYPEVINTWEELQEEADWPAVAAPPPRLPSLVASEGDRPPFVSVIIPTYNPSHLLLEAIASVERHQPSPNAVELLIVDDGSDNLESLRLLNCLANANYRIIRQKNQGLAAARNTGFSQARAHLVIPLDDDNRLLAPYLKELAPFMQKNPHVDVGYGDRLDFGAVQQRFQPGAMNRDQMITANRIDACAVIRKDLWEKAGGYDTALKALEDWDFWLTAGRLGIQSLYAAVPCFEYRVREGSMLRDHLKNKTEHVATMDYLRSKHGLPLSNLIPN